MTIILHKNNNIILIIINRQMLIIINRIIIKCLLLLPNIKFIKGKDHMMKLIQINIQNNKTIREEGIHLKNKILSQHHIRICLLLNIQFNNNINNNNNIFHLQINISNKSNKYFSNHINFNISNLFKMNMIIINNRIIKNNLKIILIMFINSNKDPLDLLCLNRIVRRKKRNQIYKKMMIN